MNRFIGAWLIWLSAVTLLGGGLILAAVLLVLRGGMNSPTSNHANEKPI